MPDIPVLPRLKVLTQNQLNLTFRATRSPIWRCRTKLHHYNFFHGSASLRTWSPRRKNTLINMCFQIQAGTDNIMDWQYCCRMTSTSQNTSACKNRHPVGRVQDTPGSGPQTVWCVHHTTNGVHVPHRHHHKPGPAGKMALLLQSGCPCSVRPTLGPTGFSTAPPGCLRPRPPTKDQAEMPCRECKKKQQLLGGAVRSQDWACSRDRRHNNSHDFCCRRYL